MYNGVMLIKQGKTNIKYLLIVVILAAVVGGGILAWQCWWLPKGEVTIPEVKMPEKDEKNCIIDEDCVWAITECSTCECGIPINKQYQEKYNIMWMEKCKDYHGPVCEYCCPFVLQCINKKCTPVEAPWLCGG